MCVCLILKGGPSLVQQLVLIAPIAYIPFELIDARILVVVYPADPIEVGHAAHILRQVLGPVELLIHNGYDVAVGVQSSHNFLQLQLKFIIFFFLFFQLSFCTYAMHPILALIIVDAAMQCVRG